MQSFAIIPAAGRSRRMGQPKLLLPWHGGTLIEHVLSAWRASRVSHVVIVVHPQDGQLAEVARQAGAIVVQPDVAPSEMKVSIRVALEFVAGQFQPQAGDAWLLAPADMPAITCESIDRLLAAYAKAAEVGASELKIWSASSAGKRGHPVLFPWPLAAEVSQLAADEGVNAIVERHPVEEVEVDVATFADLDTPEDYQHWRQRAE